eukprot:1189563-Prorocentrum_minimum.AAC.2
MAYTLRSTWAQRGHAHTAGTGADFCSRIIKQHIGTASPATVGDLPRGYSSKFTRARRAPPRPGAKTILVCKYVTHRGKKPWRHSSMEVVSEATHRTDSPPSCAATTHNNCTS